MAKETVMVRMKIAVKRVLSWLLTGASILLAPKIVYWIYYWYFYLTSLFAQAFPGIAEVFSFLDDALEDAAGAGLCGLLISYLIYGVSVLTITWSEKLHRSVLGGHFLVGGLLSLWLMARNGFSLWLIFKEAGFKNGIGSFQGVVLLLTLIAQLVYTGNILNAFSSMGSLKLLFGNRKRMVFIDMPEDVHQKHTAFAYVPDMGGLLDKNGEVNHAVADFCLNRALQAGLLAKYSDCLLCDMVLVRKNAARLKDLMAVHTEGGNVFFNPNTPWCELLRLGAKAELFFITLDNARKL